MRQTLLEFNGLRLVNLYVHAELVEAFEYSGHILGFDKLSPNGVGELTPVIKQFLNLGLP